VSYTVDIVWTVSVNPEKHGRHYSSKNKINYSTPSVIKLEFFILVFVKTPEISAWKCSSKPE
jgi:hypothetical protein